MISRRSVLGSLSAFLPASLFVASAVASEGKPQEPRHYSDEPYCPERFFSKQALDEWCGSRLFLRGKCAPFQIRAGYDFGDKNDPSARCLAETAYIATKRSKPARPDGYRLDMSGFVFGYGKNIADACAHYFTRNMPPFGTVWNRVVGRPFFCLADKNGVHYYQCDFDGPHYTFTEDGEHHFNPGNLPPEVAAMHLPRQAYWNPLTQ